MSADPHAPVLVGVDGSDEAMGAAHYAAWEAGHRGTGLTVVYAHQSTPFWGPTSLILDDYAWERDWVRSLLDKTVAEVAAAHPGVTVRADAESGGAAGVLVERSAGAQLVVVGTRATDGLMGHLLGSVAAQVAAHARCPVIVVRGTDGQSTDPAVFRGRPVVVGVDGSVESEQAIDFAVSEAVARQSDLHAVTAWDLFDVNTMDPIQPAWYDAAEEEAKAGRLLAEMLAGRCERYPDLRVVRRLERDLYPARAILRDREGVGLYVVGSRGVGGFAGLLLGSTVDALVRQAPAPVAVVHAGTDGRR